MLARFWEVLEMAGALTDYGALVGANTALSDMAGVAPSDLAQDPRLERVLDAATESGAPSDDQKWKNEQLAFAGGMAQNPLGGFLAGFGAQGAQRNKQSELLGQYLPVIAPVLMQQQQLKLLQRNAQLSSGVQSGSYPGQEASGALTATPGSAGPVVGTGGAPGAPAGGPLTGGGAPQMQQPRANMFGMIPNSAAARALMPGMPPELIASSLSPYMATDATKTAVQSGIDPMFANQAAFLHANAPEQIGRSGPMYSPLTGFKSMPSMASPGTMNQFDANGNFLGVVAERGGLSGVGASRAAELAGGNTQTVHPQAFDSEGNPLPPMTVSDVIAGRSGRYGAGSGAPGAGGAGGAGGVQLELTPQQKAAQQTQGTASSNLHAIDSAAANGYGQRMFTLDKALTGLQGADTGRGSATVNDMRNFLVAQAPEVLKKYLPGIDEAAIKNANYDEAQKYLTQYAMAQAGAMGQGTDEKLATAIAGNANTHISNLAAQDVVRANMGLEQYKNAQITMFNKSHTGPNATASYQAFANKWNSTVDPRIFVWDHLPADKQQAMFASMTAQQRATFQKQFMWADQNQLLGH